MINKLFKKYLKNAQKINWSIATVLWMIAAILDMFIGRNAEGAVACMLLGLILLKMEK